MFWFVQPEVTPLCFLQTIPNIPKFLVLIVEDDLTYETILRRILAEIDAKVQIDWVASAEEARSQLNTMAGQKEVAYDLIIADIFLDGEETGFDLWNLCKESHPLTPLIVTSGLPVDRFIRAFGQNEVCPPFLAKPFFVGECRQILENLLLI